MALTDTQIQQHWAHISKSLMTDLVTDCFRLSPKLGCYQNAHSVLSTEIRRALNTRSQENPTIITAFELFAAHLGSHNLKSSQLLLAMATFNTIPNVEKILNELPSRISILLQNQNKMHWFSTDVPYGTTLCLHLDEPLEIECSPDLEHEFGPNPLNNFIQDWVYQHYSLIDEREQTNDDRCQRRMDSLARLLALQHELSVCTSVTLDVSSTPRLLISTNVSKNGDQSRIMATMSAKLCIIKDYLQDITKLGHDIYSLDSLAQTLVEKLMPNTSIPSSVLIQAAKKIIHTICFDDETFGEKEKSAFRRDAPAIIIVPTVALSGFKMQVRNLCLKQRWIESEYDLPPLSASTRIKNIHAEQLLAYFLFVELKIQTELKSPLLFGISKLCCQTCFKNLEGYNILGEKKLLTVRGHHGQFYRGVVCLTTGESSKFESTRRATTEPISSPINTPEKKRLKRAGSAPTPMSTKRLFLTDDPPSEDTNTLSLGNGKPKDLYPRLHTTLHLRFMKPAQKHARHKEDIAISALSIHPAS